MPSNASHVSDYQRESADVLRLLVVFHKPPMHKTQTCRELAPQVFAAQFSFP